jgi:LPS export ABC transporter protein LptC
MNGSTKTLLLLGSTLLAIGGAAGFLGSRLLAPRIPTAAPAPQAPLTSLLPELNLPPMNYVVNDHGKRQWEFHAGEVHQSAGGETTALNGLKQGVYYKDGKPYLKMRSGGAVYDHIKRQLQMTGGVQVEGPKGLRFNAPSLVWHESTKQIVCAGPVTMQTPEGWIQANGTLTADLNKQTFALQQVSGQFRLDGESVKGMPL